MIASTSGRSVPPDTDPAAEVTALAELLAEVVMLAEQRAMYPGRWQHIAKLALDIKVSAPRWQRGKGRERLDQGDWPRRP